MDTNERLLVKNNYQYISNHTTTHTHTHTNLMTHIHTHKHRKNNC